MVVSRQTKKIQNDPCVNLLLYLTTNINLSGYCMKKILFFSILALFQFALAMEKDNSSSNFEQVIKLYRQYGSNEPFNDDEWEQNEISPFKPLFKFYLEHGDVLKEEPNGTCIVNYDPQNKKFEYVTEKSQNCFFKIADKNCLHEKFLPFLTEWCKGTHPFFYRLHKNALEYERVIPLQNGKKHFKGVRIIGNDNEISFEHYEIKQKNYYTPSGVGAEVKNLDNNSDDIKQNSIEIYKKIMGKFLKH